MDRDDGCFVGLGCGMMVFAVVANLVCLAAAVWVVVWVLQRTGVL